MTQSTGLNIKGHMSYVLKDEHGNVKETGEEDNLIVTIGFNNLGNLLADGFSGNQINALGLGYYDDTTGGAGAPPVGPGAGDINMPLNGGTPAWVNGEYQRKAAIVTRPTPTTIQLWASWGLGEPTTFAWGAWTCPIYCLGVFWADSGIADNELFSWVLKSVINKSNADTLEVTWTFTLS